MRMNNQRRECVTSSSTRGSSEPVAPETVGMWGKKACPVLSDVVRVMQVLGSVLGGGGQRFDSEQTTLQMEQNLW